MRIALHGATGRMGAALLASVRTGPDTVVGAIAEPGCSHIGADVGIVHGLAPAGVVVQDDVDAGVLGADVIIDFSHASAVARLAHAARCAGIPIVSGTTGLDPAGQRALDTASERVPVLWAPNFSIGIQVLAELVRHAAARLGPDFDIEVCEVHHRGKTDAPSGTALRLAREAQEIRGPMNLAHGREGQRGPRLHREMGVMALRGGDVVGDHVVHFLGAGERVELVHRATSRHVFAYGALVAARALLGRSPGKYALADVLPAVRLDR